MINDTRLKVLLVAEGSGGHLIPALEVAQRLANQGVLAKVWYAQRPRSARLLQALSQQMLSDRLSVEAIPLPSSSHVLNRVKACGDLWLRTHQCFKAFGPHIIVGFGGWICAPVMLAARLAYPHIQWHQAKDASYPEGFPNRVRTMVHEQNVVMGRANRLLAYWVNRVALSFEKAQTFKNPPSWVRTGMPIRSGIGRMRQSTDAARFGFSPEKPTVLVLGGSQGSRALNRLVSQGLSLCSEQERRQWQFLHVTGMEDEPDVRELYSSAGIQAWVSPFLVDMESAYAQADVVIARAGASTLAELASCGRPAVLIPYPYARAHQHANARLAESVGGAFVVEEHEATASRRLLEAIRWLLHDPQLRTCMGQNMQRLAVTDATQRLADLIVETAILSQ